MKANVEWKNVRTVRLPFGYAVQFGSEWRGEGSRGVVLVLLERVIRYFVP